MWQVAEWKDSFRLYGAVYKDYVSHAILYGSEALCLRQSEMGKEMDKDGESNVLSTNQNIGKELRTYW